MPARSKPASKDSTAHPGLEATGLRSGAFTRSEAAFRSLNGNRWLPADTAMRDSAIHPCEATLRSLSAAKDNRFLPVYQFADETNKKITHLAA